MAHRHLIARLEKLRQTATVTLEVNPGVSTKKARERYQWPIGIPEDFEDQFLFPVTGHDSRLDILKDTAILIVHVVFLSCDQWIEHRLYIIEDIEDGLKTFSP